MFNVGGGELLVIGLIALIVLGPQRLPDAARQIGKTLGDLRRLSTGFQAEMKSALDAVDDPARTAARRNVLAKPEVTEAASTAAVAAVSAAPSASAPTAATPAPTATTPRKPAAKKAKKASPATAKKGAAKKGAPKKGAAKKVSAAQTAVPAKKTSASGIQAASRRRTTTR